MTYEQSSEFEPEVIEVFPGCTRCGCSTFFVTGQQRPDEGFMLAEDRYFPGENNVWLVSIECVNCGATDVLYDSE